MRANNRPFREALWRPYDVGRQSSINDRYGTQFAMTAVGPIAVVQSGAILIGLARRSDHSARASRLLTQRPEQPRCAVHLRILSAPGAVRHVSAKEYAD